MIFGKWYSGDMDGLAALRRLPQRAGRPSGQKPGKDMNTGLRMLATKLLRKINAMPRGRPAAPPAAAGGAPPAPMF